MKFWRSAAALLTVFHPETTHSGNHSTPKDVKNEGRPGKVYENKGAMDKMSERMSDICARLKPFLQKIGVSSSPNTSEVPRTSRHIELVPNQQIVQAWRAADWDEGAYSIVKVEFVDQGSGSKIVFD